MNPKILIIDDNEQDRQIMSRILTQNGYDNLVLAENAQEGVEHAKAEKPFIVIIDTILPDSDGFEVCAQISAEEGQMAKIILLTGHVDAIDSKRADEVGAHQYIVKTSDYSMLVQAIEKFVDESHNVF